MEQFGLYLSGDFPEDYEMWLRWLDQGVKIAKVPEVVLDWHDSQGRLTRTHPIYSDRAFYEIKSRYLAKWLSAHNPYHPKVWVWGASRISRRRAKILEQHGVSIDVYIDIDREPGSGRVAMLPGRVAEVHSDHAWEKAVSTVSGYTLGNPLDEETVRCCLLEWTSYGGLDVYRCLL